MDRRQEAGERAAQEGIQIAGHKRRASESRTVNHRLRALGWKHRIELRDGIAQMYEAFKKYEGAKA